MKKILFVRHATALPSQQGAKDHDRPLAKKGMIDAETISKRLKIENLIPERFIASSAKRARQTAAIMQRNLNSNTRLKINKDIYYNSVEGINSSIFKTDDEVNFIAIFGHNPSLNDIYIKISNLEHIFFPTCAVALCRFDVQKWADFSIESSTLEYYDAPNNNR